ncbi:GEM-like protein 5 [Solanum lycopersicum]|uniref:GRAM domain-containing protein n=1 Tax=Solanum lycopersicum TaxID=4081 RepID=A0A3Q7HUR4_SOLLC|nr:GEM-like protein 5 [Solanum lycopersicum]
MTGTGDENQPKFKKSESQIPSVSSSSSDPQAPEMDPQKWGTHIMGPPAVPTCHPDNQKAASWRAEDQREEFQPQPYVVYSPIDKPSNNPLDSVVNVFNSWSNRAENIARNIWYNLKAGPSVTEAAWGKLNLTAKALTEGGFEPLYKQIFGADPNEQLKKTFACYLSTATGPVAGTLYLSTTKVAFCSDRPLSYKAPSGQEAWSYYKVAVPLGNIGTINPIVMKESPPERYIQIVTIDGHDFWFMGFVNFDKAKHHLLETLSIFRAQPPHLNLQQPAATY